MKVIDLKKMLIDCYLQRVELEAELNSLNACIESLEISLEEKKVNVSSIFEKVLEATK